MVQAKQLYAMWGNMQEYNWIVKMYGVMLDSCMSGTLLYKLINPTLRTEETGDINSTWPSI